MKDTYGNELKVGDTVKFTRCDILRTESKTGVISEVSEDTYIVNEWSNGYGDGYTYANPNMIELIKRVGTLSRKEVLQALIDDKPLQRWVDGIWVDTDASAVHILLSMKINNDFRIKQKTILINGYEVPEPVREPLSIDQPYYLITMVCVIDTIWEDSPNDKRRLKNGIIHLTKEAANIHRDAILSFTKMNDD